MLDILQQRLNEYQCKTEIDEENAMKEITQEVILMALSRSSFFKEAEFLGGTALRILYRLPRFSEDLDFALLKKNSQFEWGKYLTNIANELLSFGYKIEISDRTDVSDTIKKVFLKDQCIRQVMQLQFPHPSRSAKKIRIKLEIDTNPPAGSTNEIKYLDFPLAFDIRTQELTSTFAGKLHALLCRPYLKGRDWYDFSWYVMRNTQINCNYLQHALKQTGPYQGKKLTVNKNWLIEIIQQKISEIPWDKAQADVNRFIKPAEIDSIHLWSKAFFMSRLAKLETYLQ